MSVEYIMCSAVHVNDGLVYTHGPKNIESGFVVCSYRHCDCLELIGSLIKPTVSKSNYAQGFLTSHKRFVGRREALEIAKSAGQVEACHEDKQGLYSEDLWSIHGKGGAPNAIG